MKKLTFFWFVSTLVFCSGINGQDSPGNGQSKKSWLLGFNLGRTHSLITSLNTDILSEEIFNPDNLKEKGKGGWTAGIFANMGFEKLSHWRLQCEAALARQGSHLNFQNVERDWGYTIDFNYHYANIVAIAKWYPDNNLQLNGLNVYFGFQACITIEPKNDIKFRHSGAGWETLFYTDIEQEKQISSVLKRRNNIGAVLGAGYKIHNKPVVLDARGYYGFYDVHTTLSNSYNFIDRYNINWVVQATVSYLLGPKNKN